MKRTFKNIIFILISIFVSISIFIVVSTVTYAHLPRVVDSTQVNVIDAEISKAYYAELKGEPHIYLINSSKKFDLYVNILVPDIAGQKKDVSAIIYKDGESIATLDSNNFEWINFFEPFGYDSYWKWPEYKANVGAGNYKIIVSSTKNDSKYSLAIGEIEAFNFKETLNAIKIIPQLKKDFFNESSIYFIFSPFGWGLIIIIYILAFLFGFIFRLILKKITKETTCSVNKNIGKLDRLIRLIISFSLLIIAITTTWSPILIFFSGFILFEVIFSWCWFYAIIGKNTQK